MNIKGKALGNSTDKQNERRYDIDALRILATLLLIIYHTGQLFNPSDRWHIQNLELSQFFTHFLGFINQWHMPLFFLLAGSSTYLALQRRTSGQYIGERVKRLFFPLLIGVLVVIPPQLYIERIATWVPTRLSPINFSGSFWQFYPHAFECCYNEGNLSYHHLWFVAYLFVYSLFLLPLLLYLRRPAGRAFLKKLADFLTRGVNIFWPIALIALVEVSMRWRFPYWQDLIHDWANNVHYPLVFLLGFILMSDGRFKDAIFRNRHLGLIIGLLASIARIPNIDGVTGYVLDMTLRGVAEWSLLIALLGYGYQFLNRPSKLLRHTSEIAYPFYIWHQTVIVVIAFFIVRQQAGIGVKFLAISSASLLITWLICEAIKLTNITRFMFGLKAKKNTRRIEMKRLPAAMILVLMVFAATACTTVSTSGSYTLESGQTQRGNLIITSGTADLEEGSRVTGNVLMTSGVLNAEGEIGGDILFSSGDVNLGPKAAVGGDIRGTSGKVNQEDGARVDGRIQPNQSTFTIGGGIFSSIFAFLCGLPLILLGLLLVLFSILRSKPPSKTKTAETQVNPSIPAAGTTTKLQELKQLLDQGLISEDDYEAKKTEILSQM